MPGRHQTSAAVDRRPMNPLGADARRFYRPDTEPIGVLSVRLLAFRMPTELTLFFGVSDAPETTKAGSPFGPGLSILPQDESRSTGQALLRHNRSRSCRWAVLSTSQNEYLSVATDSCARCDATPTLKVPLR